MAATNGKATRTRTNYDEAFKTAAAGRVLAGEKNSKVAKELGIRASTLTSWVKAMGGTTKKKPKGTPKKRGKLAKRGRRKASEVRAIHHIPPQPTTTQTTGFAQSEPLQFIDLTTPIPQSVQTLLEKVTDLTIKNAHLQAEVNEGRKARAVLHEMFRA
jgi:transposase-like protein